MSGAPGSATLMAYVCCVTGCDEIATITVEHRDQAERPLCAAHWELAHSASPVALTAVRTLPRPACFVRGCDSGAVTVMEHIDASLLPCCETHLNDLSWVVPEHARSGSGHEHHRRAAQLHRRPPRRSADAHPGPPRRRTARDQPVGGVPVCCLAGICRRRISAAASTSSLRGSGSCWSRHERERVRRRTAASGSTGSTSGRDPLTGKRRRPDQVGLQDQEGSRSRRCARPSRPTSGAARCARPPDRRATSSREWHAAVEPSLRPTTWVNYRDYMDAYVIPIIGETRLQDLTPVRLNLLYGAPARRRAASAARAGWRPKTVQNVHRMLHRALRDAVKWDLVPRNVAEDAQPPRVAPTAHRRLDARAARKLRRPGRGRPLLRAVAARGHHRPAARRARRAPPRATSTSSTAASPRAPRASSSPAGPRSPRPRPEAASRALALDPRHVAGAARLHRVAGPRSGELLGPGHRAAVRLARRAARSTPTRSPRSSTGTARRPGSRGSGCTTSGTRTPPPRSRPGSRPRSSANGSGTRPPPSPCRPTPTSSRAWTRRPPTPWPP